MCGIWGYAGRPKNARELQAFLRVLAIETSARGTDATGFAALNDDGTFIGSKAAQPAAKFVMGDKTFARALFTTDAAPRLMIGHCRLATHGDKEQNKNNHPHVSKDRMLAIVHNGIVFGHEQLATEIGRKLHSQCDSEVILRLVESSIPAGEKHCYDRLVDACQTLEDFDAMFSVLVLDKARRSVWAFRNHANPMVYWESEHLGVTVFASEVAHIKSAVKIIIGNKEAKAMVDECMSPVPGRVARFSDKGTVSFSNREATCLPLTSSKRYSYSGSAAWADELSWDSPMHERSKDKVAPYSWTPKGTSSSSDAQGSLPHTKQCVCSACVVRAKDHAPSCECFACERKWKQQGRDAFNKAQRHGYACPAKWDLSAVCDCEETSNVGGNNAD